MTRVANLGSDIQALVAEISAQDSLAKQLEGPATLSGAGLRCHPTEHFAARLIDAVLTMAGPLVQPTAHIRKH